MADCAPGEARTWSWGTGSNKPERGSYEVPEARALHAHRRTVRGVWEVSRTFGEQSLPLILREHPALVRLLRADVLGPTDEAASLRRMLIRAATAWPLPEALLAMLERTPNRPWPDKALDYLIASAWRRGLDTAAREDAL